MFRTSPDPRHHLKNIELNALDIVYLKFFSNSPEGRAIIQSAELILDNQQACLFSERDKFLAVMCGLSLDVLKDESLVLEFGVFEGDSLRTISSIFKPYGAICYGFDTFEGLTEEWKFDSCNKILPKGSYSTCGRTPENMPSNCRYVVGDASKKIETFLRKHQQEITFVHFDMDTYTPTYNVLKAISKRLVPGSIVCFDEHHGYPGWKEGEFKALRNAFENINYEYIAFTEMAAAIRIL